MRDRLKAKEPLVEDLEAFREKSNKYFQMLTASNNENNGLRSELQTAVHERNEAILKSQNYEGEIQELKEEVYQSSKEFKQAQQVLEDYSYQIKELKNELENQK